MIYVLIPVQLHTLQQHRVFPFFHTYLHPLHHLRMRNLNSPHLLQFLLLSNHLTNTSCQYLTCCQCPPDIRPIAVGETLRRLTGKCLCAVIKDKASELFHPLQFGVACTAGSEKIIHGLRKCIEDHWDFFRCAQGRREERLQLGLEACHPG